MLAYVSADCSRNDWVRIVAALKAGLEEEGWQVFDEWSQTAPDRYDKADCRRTWESITPEGDVGWGTLVHSAKAGGWEPPADTAQFHQWTIRELDGTAVALHHRRTLPNGKKRQWWTQPDGTNGLGGRKPRTLPLYGVERLAGTATATAVVVVEGEKAADALRDGEPTVLVLGTVTGAASVPDAAVLQPVVAAGLPVYLWPDADEPGRKHMDRVAARLAEAGGKPPSIIEWKDASPKGDAADWLAAGKEPPFAELTDAAAVVEPTTRRRRKPPRKAPASQLWEIPVIVQRHGERSKWTRDAITALVAAGKRNDRESLYEGTRTVKGKGDPAGDLLLLRAATPRSSGGQLLQHADGVLLFAPATSTALQARLDTAARWYQVRRSRGGDDEELPGEITRGDAEMVVERYRIDCLTPVYPRFRVLQGIVDAPTLRRDGSLLNRPGYDRASGLYADFDPEDWPPVPPNPTRDDARRALTHLYDLVKETPFAAPEHRAAWVATLLTVVARDYAAGCVPLLAVSANVRGAGKGTLADVISEIATGRGATKWAPVSGRRADAAAEERKRLMAVALSGARLLCIDNIKAGDPLGSPALDAAVTAGDDYEIGRIGDRVLGETSETEAPWRCVVIATGNNLVVSGDLDRRGLLCQLQSHLATPETRRFQHYPKLLEHVRKHRPALLTAALTVLIAHKRAVDAGEPDTALPPIGSFGGWSSRIRSAVWWADPHGCDPWEANRELREQALPEQAEALAFLAAWHGVFGEREITTADIDQRCHDDKDQTLAAAVADLDIAPPRAPAAVNTRSLGAWLTARAGRPGDYMLQKGTGMRKWFVVNKTLTKVDRAIQDLMTNCPDLSIFGILFDRKALHDILKRLRDAEVLALRDWHKDGRELADAITQAADLVSYHGPTKVRMTADDSMKEAYPELNDEERAVLWLVQTIFGMAWVAESNRQLGPEGEQIRDRFNKSNAKTVNQRVAWNLLKEADRALGPEADAKALVKKAVELLIGESDELSRLPQEVAERYDADDIEAAIQELAGLQDPAPPVAHR